MNRYKPSIKQFEGDAGKIVTLLKVGDIVIRTESFGAKPGVFPLTGWYSFPLEIPSRCKKSVFGRFLEGIENESAQMVSEVIGLPVFHNEDICDAETFNAFPNEPEIQKANAKTSFVTIATKTWGMHSDDRLVQSISVLPIWNDGMSIVLQLDWSAMAISWRSNFVEDVINPQWYIKASPRLPVKDALQKLRECSKRSPIARKFSRADYFLYVNPYSLGTQVLGEGQEHPSEVWCREWRFDTCDKMLNGLDELAKVTAVLFE